MMRKEGQTMEKTREKVDLKDVVKITYLTPENASFSEKNSFISFKGKILKPDENYVYTETEAEYKRVFLQRIFPHDMFYKYISVLDEDNAEIGIISDISLFDEETVKILKRELDRKYYIVKLKKIISVKEKYGFSYWKAETEYGEISFTLHDTSRSITKVGEDKLFISDVDANRYEIESYNALDKKSRKSLELYI